MTRVAPIVPAETDLLCEACGYTLTGLPDHSNCPECGRPIRDSVGSQRQVPAWEQQAGRGLTTFLKLSIEILVRPTRFYRTLATRRDVAPARRFARVHWAIASLLFALAAHAHYSWYLQYSAARVRPAWTDAAAVAVIALLTFATLAMLTAVAARLTNWEATYRGLRLPMIVVLRGMYYHAAHYLPVALLALVTVVGYRVLVWRQIVDVHTVTTYLYVLSAEVIACAAYLFQTYWIGMRNMMYANR